MRARTVLLILLPGSVALALFASSTRAGDTCSTQALDGNPSVLQAGRQSSCIDWTVRDWNAPTALSQSDRRLSGPITKRLSYSVESSRNLNTSFTPDTTRFQSDVRYQLTDHWSANFRFKQTKGLVNSPQVGFGLHYQW